MSESVKAIVFDGLTNKVEERSFTKEQLDYRNLLKTESDLRVAETTARELSRESALAKLSALGLTEEEIAAL
jgi:hypothetical protein